MSKKDKKMLIEGTKVRWARIANIVDDKEARRRTQRLNEAKRTFPGNEVELEEDMEMNPDGGYHYLEEEDEELADLGGEEAVDMDYDMADDTMDMGDDLGGDDLGGDDLGMGGDMGDETLAADLITAVSDAIASVLGTDAEVDAEVEMDYDVEDMGDVEAEDELGAVGDEAGMDDMEMGMDDDELMEELENSINPSGGKVDDVDGSYYDHDLKDEKSHLKNSINEETADRLAENIVRKLARHLARRK